MSENEKIIPEEAPVRGKRMLPLILAGAILAAAVAGMVFFRIHNSPNARVERAETAGDSEAVDALFEKYGEELVNDVGVAEFYNKRIEEVERSFRAETIEYASAVTELDRIRSRGVTGTLEMLNSSRKRIDALNSSRVAYKTAESFFATENYREAIDQYRKVIEDDPNYTAAAAKIEACYNNYRSTILAEAESMAVEGAFETAIGVLESALSVLPNDASIQEKIILYKSKLSDLEISDALARAAECAEKGDYAGAIRAIAQKFKENPDNSQLTARYSEYTKAYELQVLNAVDILSEERKYDEAIEQARAAQSLLPDSQVLTEKIAALEASKPTPLSNLGTINGGWTWNEGTPEDPFGNNYSGSVNFVIKTDHDRYQDGANHYAEYRLDGKYTTLTGVLVPYISIARDSTFQVQVYTDDGSNNYQLVYTSPDIGRKTDAYSFEANIAGAKYVKVNIILNDEAAAIVANLQLWPK